MYRNTTWRAIIGQAAIVGVVLALALSGCADKPPAASTSKPADKVTYLTGFQTTPREGYGFVAKGAGLFSAAGIDVNVQAGNPSDANLKLLAAGKAQFASVDFVSAVRGAKTYPGLRIVMAVQQTTLLSIITMPGRGITEDDPASLIGKTIGTAPAAASQTLFPRYANLAKFDGSKVKFANFQPNDLPALMVSGKIDAMGAYAIDTPGIKAAAHGVDPVVLPISKYITDLYGTVIVTTTKLIHDNPDLVRRFVGAMWKGIQYAVNHTDGDGKDPRNAGALLHQAVPADDAGIMRDTMKLMKNYATSPQLEPGRVARGIALLETAQMADSGLQPDQVVDFSFAKTAA